MKKYMNFRDISVSFGKYFVPESGHLLCYEGNDNEKQAVILTRNNLNKVRNENVRMKFWNENLPYFFRIMDEKGDVRCSDLLKIFQAIIDEMLIKYENLHYYIRLDGEKGIFHPFFMWLLQIQDDYLSEKLDTNEKIKQYFEILKQRGTVKSLVRLIRLIFGIKCDIRERIDIGKEFPELIFPYPVRREQVFEVELSQKIEPLSALKKIIHHHKPIHTICIISYVEKNQKKILAVL